MKRPSLKRIATRTFAVVVLVLGLLYLVGATAIDRLANRAFNQPPYEVSSTTTELYNDLFVVDLHADPLLWGRDLLSRHRHGSIDVPRLIEGNVAIQSMFIVSKVPFFANIEANPSDSDMITTLAVLQGWPVRTWGSLLERAIYQAYELQGFAERGGGRLLLLSSKSDLRNYQRLRRQSKDVVGIVLGVEGAQVLEGDLENVGRLFDYGIRIIGLVHFFDNEVGGSAHGEQKGGITEFGKAVVREMEEYGITVDLAHASEALITDALQISTRPVIASHTGVRGTCDNNRNLSDAQIQGIAKTGGVIGIGYWETATCGTDAQAIVRAMHYVVDLVGVEHVGLGSDFDGAVVVPFDTTGLPLIVEALTEDGFDQAAIRKIMGGNAARLFAQALP